MYQYALLAVAGVLSVAAFAPMEFWWLMPFCLMVVYFNWVNEKRPLKAFKQGFVFALFQFGVGVSWVYVSLHNFGNMPPLMAGTAVFLFVLVLALFYALVGYFFVVLSYQFKKSQYVIKAIIFASLWVLADWSRTFVLTGFPWLDVGYSQTTQLLSAYAPIGGIYLVSFVLLVIVALLTQLLLIDRLSYRTICPPTLIIVSLIVLAFGLKFIKWSTPVGEEISVALVQADIPIEQKWQSSFRDTLLKRYFDLLPKTPVDLVVFSETAMPFYLHNTTSEFWEALSANSSTLITGITEADASTDQLYNSAVMTCDGQEQQLYRKQHLVPFGEYLPLRKALSWVLDYLQLPMSDFSAWKQPQSLNCGQLKVALSICYEDAFAEEIRSNLGDGQVLVNISEDAWFGDSLAPHQRRQMAQMRAQELSRPMVRSSNSGPSNLINAEGEIIASSKQFSQETLVGKVMPRTGSTPFLSYGIWVVYLAGLVAFFALVLKVTTRKL